MLRHYIYHLFYRLSFLFYSLNLLKLFYWSVKCGSNLRFQGVIGIYKAPNSSINIGSFCTFLSHSFSNRIGINRPCQLNTMKNHAVIDIGNNCGFSGTIISSFLAIKIGDNVKCGANTLITDSDWHSEDSRAGSDRSIVIGNNVWLGEGVKVLKGVTIGDNVMVGAGSIVTKDIPANTLAAGNPCKVIRSF